MGLLCSLGYALSILWGRNFSANTRVRASWGITPYLRKAYHCVSEMLSNAVAVHLLFGRDQPSF
jgi:hypothetical protein